MNHTGFELNNLEHHLSDFTAAYCIWFTVSMEPLAKLQLTVYSLLYKWNLYISCDVQKAGSILHCSEAVS